MFKFIAKLFAPKPPRELIFVSYSKANDMLLKKEGWRLAPEEDKNRVAGMVWLERSGKKD